uniref:Uncharacterized protein n=1 Tax=Siphoviridae sp. ctYJD4 TaxID=2826375 RepID=A0A8S5N1J1_9CAUD|nr:MAG TPA: hypothetical protein [Siphoviridae sp. ctYJD4]
MTFCFGWRSLWIIVFLLYESPSDYNIPFKGYFSVSERSINLSKIYNYSWLSIPISLQCKLTEIVNL